MRRVRARIAKRVNFGKPYKSCAMNWIYKLCALLTQTHQLKTMLQLLHDIGFLPATALLCIAQVVGVCKHTVALTQSNGQTNQIAFVYLVKCATDANSIQSARVSFLVHFDFSVHTKWINRAHQQVAVHFILLNFIVDFSKSCRLDWFFYHWPRKTKKKHSGKLEKSWISNKLFRKR